MPVEYDTSTVGSRKSKKEDGLFGKLGTLSRRKKSLPPEENVSPSQHPHYPQQPAPDEEEAEADLVEKEGREAIDSSLVLPQPDLRNLEDGQQIRTLTIESREDPRVQEIIHLLLYWMNEELASERIVVKNIQEDIYDGQIIQKLLEKLAQIKIEVPEVSQSEEGQKQKLRIIIDALNRNLSAPGGGQGGTGVSPQKWTAELIHSKDIVAILHLLVNLAIYYRAPVRFPNNVNVQVLIYQRNGKQISKNIVTEQLTTKQTELAPKTENQPPFCTPAVDKVRQTRIGLKVYSPSDSLMSPCTKLLAGNSKAPKNAISHPQSVLRNKQKNWLEKHNLPED